MRGSHLDCDRGDGKHCARWHPLTLARARATSLGPLPVACTSATAVPRMEEGGRSDDLAATTAAVLTPQDANSIEALSHDQSVRLAVPVEACATLMFETRRRFVWVAGDPGPLAESPSEGMKCIERTPSH